MHDVAALAGVSAITVSRVVNSPSKVAPATRARVEAAIERLGYVPNLTAGSLASRRTRIIGAIVPTIANSIFAETIQGLSEGLATAGYQLMLGQSGYEDAREDALVAAFVGRRVDGLVLTGVGHSRRTRRQLLNAAVPVVETWELTRQPIDMVVGFSNFEAGAAMGRHLLSRGWRRLAFVGGSDERSVARGDGLLQAARAARAPAPARRIIDGATTLAAGRDAIAQLMRGERPPQAVFFSNDVLAAGALLECAARGWSVPDQVAVAGLGDFELAAQLSPALTTVRIPMRAIGESAARLLLDRLSGVEPQSATVDVGFEIVVRGSA